MRDGNLKHKPQAMSMGVDTVMGEYERAEYHWEVFSMICEERGRFCQGLNGIFDETYVQRVIELHVRCLEVHWLIIDCG